MPSRWEQTVDEHRGSVRDAVLDAVADLVAERGLTAVSMASLAEASGIGRATLYRYFPDLDAVLTDWHERQLGIHLAHLSRAASRSQVPGERLRDVLTAYAHMSSRHGGAGGDIAAALHTRPHAARTRDQVLDMVTGLVRDAAAAGEVRDDMPAAELAGFCLHALGAAGARSSGAAVRRLVGLTLDGLTPRA